MVGLELLITWKSVFFSKDEKERIAFAVQVSLAEAQVVDLIAGLA